MGIDLGTASVLVYIEGRDVVLREPSVVVMEKDTGKILAIGNEAKKMIGKVPQHVEAIRPLRNGVIADFSATEKMIRYFIRKVHDRKTLIHPRVVIGVPSAITEVEKRAVRESVEQAGAREVHLIEEPMAAAIGAGIPVEDPEGNMIVDVGGGTTEIAVVSLGGMVVKKSLPIAGDKMDDAIVQYFRKKHNLNVGENTAEDVKFRIGSVYPVEKEDIIDVKGRDSGGLPRIIKVSSEEIREALEDRANEMVEAIKEVLEQTPPELAADIVDHGILLSGGGSLIRGLPELLSKRTELPVMRADDPLHCVVRGTGIVLRTLKKANKNRLDYKLLD
jgi:rod shape-determining protein MreB